MLFQKHFILLISVSFIDLLKSDLAAYVGGGGGGGGGIPLSSTPLLQTDC